MPDDAAAPTMTTILNSSNVHSIGRDGSALLVRFKGSGGLAGKLYRYPGAAEHHDKLLEAASPGGYLRSSVIGKFTHEAGE